MDEPNLRSCILECGRIFWALISGRFLTFRSSITAFLTLLSRFSSSHSNWLRELGILNAKLLHYSVSCTQIYWSCGSSKVPENDHLWTDGVQTGFRDVGCLWFDRKQPKHCRISCPCCGTSSASFYCCYQSGLLHSLQNNSSDQRSENPDWKVQSAADFLSNPHRWWLC